MDGYLVRFQRNPWRDGSRNQSQAELQKLSEVWIEAQVPGQDIPLLSLEDAGFISVLSMPAVRFPASVTRVGPVVSPTTRTQRIWLTPNAVPDGFVLRAGMQLSVAMSVHERVTTLGVLLKLFCGMGMHAFVFVQKSDGYLERRRVTTGRTDGQWTEVRDGLSPGDEIVVAGGRELQTAYVSLR